MRTLKNGTDNYFIFQQKNEEWKLVFWDDKSFLYLKNKPEFKEIIDKYEYKYVTLIIFFIRKIRLIKELLKDPEQVKKEIKRKLAETPDGLIIIQLTIHILPNF